jgi:pantoate--beta-alanine ligase
MESVDSIARARAAAHTLPRPLGFVPTMGALHDGHLELVRRARMRTAAVVVSVFVNPLQFAPNEDLAAYPRNLAGDCERLAAAGVDVFFAPQTSTMYGQNFSTVVETGALAQRFEGARRPSHFRGVTTVIAKLLNIVQPDVMFLGQKDAQQAVIVRKMIDDLNFAVETEIVPTVREKDGLAMSSRNRYLDDQQRAQAPTLYRALCAARDAFERGLGKPEAIAAGTALLGPAAMLDYLDLVDEQTFEPIERLGKPAFLIGAARLGPIRLIDNLWIDSSVTGAAQ